MKVKVESYRGVMNYCTCDKCDWDVDTNGRNDPAHLAKQHIKQNPTHTVTRVYGSEFIYKSERLK